MRNLINIALIVVVCLILFACSSEWSENEEKPRFIIILLDETVSFRLTSIDFWPEICFRASKIVSRLQPGEAFVIIGIDGHGFDPDDVRIPSTILDESFLKAVQQKRKVVKQIKELKRRPSNFPYTDIMGALQQTANLLKGESDYEAVIAIFSDMIQTPRFPRLQDATGLSFPENTRVYCFYVNATEGNLAIPGTQSWDRIVNAWVPIFEHSGLIYKQQDGNDNFLTRDKTNLQFDRIFPK